MKAPFPWFGGKSRVAHLVWERFGNVPNYVEPFAGSLAVLLNRPHEPRNETVNDKDCYLANFWRALQADPESVAFWADSPVNEADLHARHHWLIQQTDFQERMKTDPDYFDSKIAGWWVWGLSLWIGSGWCSHPEWTGRSGCERSPKGIHAKRPQLKRGGTGVHRQARAELPWRQKPDISGTGGASGRGVHAAYCSDLYQYMAILAERLRRTRVCCGDWLRILGPSPTTHIGLTGVFLDPPYDLRSVRGVSHGSDGAAPTDAVYNYHSNDLSAAVRTWAIEHGSDPLLRIAVCGYEGEHDFPGNWECVYWKANGGYSNQAERTRRRPNAARERIWFSPHCIKAGLFSDLEISA